MRLVLMAVLMMSEGAYIVPTWAVGVAAAEIEKAIADADIGILSDRSYAPAAPVLSAFETRAAYLLAVDLYERAER